MRPLRFCQACGERLAPHGSEAAKCSACGRTWYQNMGPTAGAAIVRGDEVLVTTRALEPEKGRCDVPGGFLQMREHPVDAVKREVKEELGIAIDVGIEDIVQIVPHAYGDDGEWVLAIGFRARWAGGDPRPADDVASVEWVGRERLEQLDFAWEHDRDLARRALDGR